MLSDFNNRVQSPLGNKKYEILKDAEEINEPCKTPQRLRIFYSLFLCTRVSGFLLIALVIVWIVEFRGGFFSNNFNWHPIFMVFGTVFIYSRGMLFYRSERTIELPRLKVMYARLMIGGGIFIVTGLIAGFEKADFTESVKTDSSIFCKLTLHSWVGAVSVIIFFLQCIVDLHSWFHPRIQMRWEVYMTLASFIGSIVACILGFDEMNRFVEKQGKVSRQENIVLWFIYSTLITFGGLSVYLFSKDCYKRSERPGDEEALKKSSVFKHILFIPWSFEECTYSWRFPFSKTRSSSHSLVNVQNRISTPRL